MRDYEKLWLEGEIRCHQDRIEHSKRMLAISAFMLVVMVITILFVGIPMMDKKGAGASSYDTSTPGTTTPEGLRGIDGRVYEISK